MRFQFRKHDFNLEKSALKERASNSNTSSLARKIGLFVLRNEHKVTSFQTTRLRRINERSNKPVISSTGAAVVSVTSYGSRLKTVHLLLESIASGIVLPSRLILWVDTEEAYAKPSLQLRRLIDRGVELRQCGNFGPHTKYYPYLISTESFDLPLATADDDQLYPRWWLKNLLCAYQEHPNCISCYRAHRVEMDSDAMAPYQSWRPCRTTSASF